MPFNLPLMNEFLHHVINWITCLIDWQLLSYRANWVTGNTWGAKHTQNSPQSWHIAPLLEGAPSQCRNIQRGGAGGNCGGGWGGGRTPGSGPKNQVQGGDEGGRSQGRDRSRRHTAGPRPQLWWWSMIEPMEGGAMEERRPWTPWGRPTAAEQVVEDGGREPTSQGDAEDLWGPGEPRRSHSEWGPRWSHLLSDWAEDYLGSWAQPVRPGARAGDRVHHEGASCRGLSA